MAKWSRIAVAAFLALLIGGCGGSSNPGSTSRLNLTTCTVQGIHARCGQLVIPENPSAPNGRKISLRVVVVPASSSDRAPDPLFYLAGGSGQAASDSTGWAYTHFNPLNQHHDIVLIDQRGTGGSNQVSCSISLSPQTEAALAATLDSCLASIREKADPVFYTTPVSVDDFDRVRAALGYDKIDLYGGSYGVSSGLDYIQRHGDHVRAAVFESGSLLDVRLWERQPISAQHSLEELFARCSADTACAAAFPNLRAEFATVTTRLSRAPIASQIVDPASGGFLRLDLPVFLGVVIDYLSDARVAASLPKDIHSAAMGDWSAFMNRFSEAASESSSKQVMNLTISCSDQWAAQDPATIKAVGADSTFTPTALARAAQATAVCKHWPQASGANGPVSSSAPIVFLNGTADPVDPPANVAGALATMPNSLVVPVPGFGHGVIDADSTSCLADKAVSFIEVGRPSKLSDWTCPNLLPDFVTQ